MTQSNTISASRRSSGILRISRSRDGCCRAGVSQAASLTYESLLELLQVTWVQGGLDVGFRASTTLRSEHAGAERPPLDAGFLDRAHRFLRLWLATGYKMWELDLLLQRTRRRQRNSTECLIALQAFRQLQNATGLAVDQLLAFYQNIERTHRDPDGSATTPLYAQIYLNPTVTWVAPDPDLVNLPTGGAIGDTVLSDHARRCSPRLASRGPTWLRFSGLPTRH